MHSGDPTVLAVLQYCIAFVF